MFIEFNVGNYLSFKDRVKLSMVASTDDALQESNVFHVGKRRLVKSAVIYGANASGKSNLLDAMGFMRNMVIKSSKDTQANEDIEVTPFKLSTECDGKPSFFEIMFIWDNCTYRYGFETDRKSVHSEWLFSIPRTKGIELFVREGKEIKVNSTRFKEGLGLEDKTRENALFLSVCAQFNGPVSKDILFWFKDMGFVYGLGDYGYLEATVDFLKDSERKHKVMEMTRIADLSIEDVEGRKKKITVEDLPKEMPDQLKKEIMKDDPVDVELKTIHLKFGKDGEEIDKVVFDLAEEESGGTRKFLTIAGPLLQTIETGSVLLIDELDARLHPLLTRAIVMLFNSHMNSQNAQLIFVSHDTSLLSNKLFRRDQIWLTEKDKYGATSLYSLNELRGVRKKAAFGKDYILGKYGAIPFIGDTKWLFCEESNE
jgi:AAA15 family ATPase/GTPase